MPRACERVLWGMPATQENPSTDVSRRWMYATGALTAALIFQFMWWNKKAPEVLKSLGSGKSGGY